MVPEDFIERMSKLAEMIVNRAGSCHNEEQTKQSLIQPVIHVLGYDIFNPSEVIMEYACDAPVLKTRNGKPESVDYAIRIAGHIAILIEAKDTNENLDKHGGQLARYFMSTDCRHAVLTNGLEWRFFSDLDKDNVMDKDPYRTIDMRNLAMDDIEFLSGFRKEGFSEEELRNEAERAMYASKISDYIKRNIIDNMSDEIIRVILGHVYDGIKSAAMVARFRPMISEEFDKCVAEKYAIKSSLVRKTDGYQGSANDMRVVANNEEDDTTAGVSALPGSDRTATASSFPIEVFLASDDGAFEARGLYLGGNRMTVLAGSKVNREERPYISGNARNLRHRFVDANGIVTEDITVDSASTAGAFVNGGTCDAGRQWKVADGRTLLDVLGGETWGEASRIAPNESSDMQLRSFVNNDATTLATGDDNKTSIPIFMKTRHAETPTSYDATATYLGNKRCRLHAGSQCAKRCDSYASNTTRRLRDEHLNEEGIVIKELEGSLSMVGTVIRGSTCDGTRRWRLADGRQIREILIANDSARNVPVDEMPTDDADGNDIPTVSWPIRVFYESTNRATCPFSATARVYEDGTTIIEAGSVISSFTAPSLNESARNLREIELAKLNPSTNGQYILGDGQEIRCDSSSLAGKFVSGTSVSGNMVWRDENGRRLGEIR